MKRAEYVDCINQLLTDMSDVFKAVGVSDKTLKQLKVIISKADTRAEFIKNVYKFLEDLNTGPVHVYRSIRNKANEETWLKYEELQITDLPEITMLNRAIKLIKKAWPHRPKFKKDTDVKQTKKKDVPDGFIEVQGN